MNGKIFILLPDGIGLRNFAYTSFPEIAKNNGLDIVFWNNTPFDLTSLGLREIKIDNARPAPSTDIFKRARTLIDLENNIKRTGDDVYKNYRFPLPFNSVKSAVKSLAVTYISKSMSNARGLLKVRENIKQSERKTEYYKQCLETLKRENPAMVFCTNQRPLTAIAPILAAQDLGIPTCAFIFSWDNLPKATMVVETDHYFVWSEHMKRELLEYYPYIPQKSIHVTGTPQFEPHNQPSLLMPRESFFSKYGLDPGKRYICYSGDDITTSPNDPQYLQDTAAAVRKLNASGENIGIIFRRCPVDFSPRYDEVLNANSDIIKPIDPDWEKVGDMWNAVLPTKRDMVLQVNTIAYTECVINVGSSMVFDYCSFGKPCAYVNYDGKMSDWKAERLYNFVHFRSMPDKKSVEWVNSPEDFEAIIPRMINGQSEAVNHAKEWFRLINQHPVDQASQRIVSAIKEIIK